MLTSCEKACSLGQDVFHRTKKHFAAPTINLCQRCESSPLASCGQGHASGCR